MCVILSILKVEREDHVPAARQRVLVLVPQRQRLQNQGHQVEVFDRWTRSTGPMLVHTALVSVGHIVVVAVVGSQQEDSAQQLLVALLQAAAVLRAVLDSRRLRKQLNIQ